MNPHYQEQCHCGASLKEGLSWAQETPWGWTETTSTTTDHSPTMLLALPTLALFHTMSIREDLMTACEEDGTSFLPWCQSNGAKQSQ